MARRRRRLGEVRHDPTKIWQAAMRYGMRKGGARHFKIDVQVYRVGHRGGYSAWACIPKGTMRNTLVLTGGRGARMRVRCGGATAATPTRAVRGALAKLTRATR